MLTTLETIVKVFHNHQWDMISLSSNPNITKEFILNNHQFGWKHHLLIQNPNLTVEDLTSLLKITEQELFKKYAIVLFYNPNITIQYIEKYMYQMYDYNFDDFTKSIIVKNISSHPSVPMKFILKHPQYNWDIDSVFKNPNFYWEFKDPIIDMFIHYHSFDTHSLSRHTFELSKNSNITLSIIQNNPHFPWNYRGISQNPNITLDWVKHVHYSCSIDFDWFAISKNPSITETHIIEYPDLPWSNKGISQNPNILPSSLLFKNIIEQTILADTNSLVYHISNNPNITFDVIEYLYERCSYTMRASLFLGLSSNLFQYQNTDIQYWYQRKHQTIQTTLKLKEELIMTTWHPDRVNEWCFHIHEWDE